MVKRVGSVKGTWRAMVVVCAALPLIASGSVDTSESAASGSSQPAPDQALQAPDSPLAKSTVTQVKASLQTPETPDVEGLATVAAITVDAIARGDAKALHQLARSRGAVIPAERMENLRAIVKGRPPEIIPANTDKMTDDEVVAEVNKIVKPLKRVSTSGVNALRVEDSRVCSALNALVQGPAFRTQLRRKYAGEPITAWDFSFAPDDVALKAQPGSMPTVVVEFEGESIRGKVLVVIAFYYNPTTGWLPAGMMHCGAQMSRPI